MPNPATAPTMAPATARPMTSSPCFPWRMPLAAPRRPPMIAPATALCVERFWAIHSFTFCGFGFGAAFGGEVFVDARQPRCPLRRLFPRRLRRDTRIDDARAELNDPRALLAEFGGFPLRKRGGLIELLERLIDVLGRQIVLRAREV